MDFREIQYILAIQKHQTLSGAARALDMTQPSLSKFLQNVERKLSTPLFKRIDNKMYLTYAGEQYVETGVKILDLNHQFHNTIADINADHQGSLSIGITPTRGRYVLPNVLPKFHALYPKYKITILEDGVSALNQALDAGQINLALYTIFETYRPHFIYEKICQEEVVLCISPSNPAARYVVQKPDQRHPWIDIDQLESELFYMVDEKFRTRKIADRILSRSTIRPQSITLQNVETALSLAASGIGVSFCTDMCETFFDSSKPLLFCSVGKEKNLWDFVIAYRDDYYLSNAAQKFIELTKQAFKKPPEL